MQAPAQSQAAYSYGQQQMAPNPYAMWPQAMSNPYGGASQFMYPGYMGAYGAGAGAEGKDATANGDAAAYTNGAAAVWHEQAAAAKAASAGGAGGGGSNGKPNGEVWMDERELKRQRRKQSNRESARRSRLRKQAECEELGGRVDALSTENVTLRAELERLKRLAARSRRTTPCSRTSSRS